MNCQKEMGIFTIYDRGLRVMGEQETKESTKSNNVQKVLSIFGIIGGSITLIGFIVGVVLGVMVPLTKHGDAIEGINDSIKRIEDGVNTLSDNISSLTYYSADSKQNNENKDENTDVGSLTKNVKLYEEYQVCVAEVDNGVGIAPAKFDRYVNVGEDVIDNTQYLGSDLVNQTIVTSYEQGENEIYFLGQYNENGNWQGECILNIYNDKKLQCIFQGIYNNGKLFSYRRISCDNGENWTYADRLNMGEYKSGKTINYKKDIDFRQKVSLNNCNEEEILTCEYIVEQVEDNILSYYKGYTSDGYYNDTTGNAYLVKFNENGEVNYLYVGKIENGNANDKTGDAWSIAWGYANDGYHYYKGTFTNGEQDKKPKSWYKPMTQEEIDAIVNQEDFDCELTGLLPKEA